MNTFNADVYKNTNDYVLHCIVVWVLQGQIDDINVINFGKGHTKKNHSTINKIFQVIFDILKFLKVYPVKHVYGLLFSSFHIMYVHNCWLIANWIFFVKFQYSNVSSAYWRPPCSGLSVLDLMITKSLSYLFVGLTYVQHPLETTLICKSCRIRFWFAWIEKSGVSGPTFTLQIPILVNVDETTSDSKVHGAIMEPTWVLSAPDGPHVGPMNLAIRDVIGRVLRVLTYWSHATLPQALEPFS